MTLGLFDVGFLGGLGAGVALDPDAQAYITAVEAADGQALETAARTVINDFVVGCKADGIWAAIKASCVLAGARTLNGCLVPLVGVAPTNFNFVAGDYNRKTGLVGDRSIKYVSTNVSLTSFPVSNNHFSVYVSSPGTTNATRTHLAAGPTGTTGPLSEVIAVNNNTVSVRNLIGGNPEAFPPPAGSATGLMGSSRSLNTQYIARVAQQNLNLTLTASTLPGNAMHLFRRNLEPSASTLYSDARLAFYSIGESLDLALLDARVTALINAFAAVIP
jgi:hypothetical protein